MARRPRTKAGRLDCADGRAVRAYLADRARPRVLALFAAACCRRIWPLLPAESSRAAVERLEQYVDGEARITDLAAAAAAAAQASAAATAAVPAVHSAEPSVEADIASGRYWAAGAVVAAVPILEVTGPAGSRRRAGPPALEVAHTAWSVAHVALMAAEAAIRAARAAEPEAPRRGVWSRVRDAENLAQCDLLADVAGPPDRRPTITPVWLAWREGAVRRIAETIYAERAFDRLSILADALEEAGCDDSELLAHLRGPGPHVRGCWALDLLLGKA